MVIIARNQNITNWRRLNQEDKRKMKAGGKSKRVVEGIR
jgi:hypothetical protein